MFVAAKIVHGKIMSFDTVGREPAGNTRSIPRGIDTSSPSRRISEGTGREHPVGVKTSAVTFEPAMEPQSVATLDPTSPI
jgi:hypothetical protein